MVRVFNDDGPKGTYRRLILYKEDEQGFPRKQEIPKDHEFTPNKEIIESYISEGELVYNEIADVYAVSYTHLTLPTICSV